MSSILPQLVSATAARLHVEKQKRKGHEKVNDFQFQKGTFYPYDKQRVLQPGTRIFSRT